MLEAKIIIDAPELQAAINNLADAIRETATAPTRAKRTKAEPKPVAPAEPEPVAVDPVIPEQQFTPVEPVAPEPPLAAVPATEPEPSFIEEIPPDEPVSPVAPVAQTPVAPVPAISEPMAVPQSPVAPVAPVEQAPAKKYTFKQISTAGAKLCANVGNMDKLVTLLNQKYGVPAITMIKEELYPELAQDLIALGATIEEE